MVEITMATNGSDAPPNDEAQSVNLEAVSRISKIPVVESTIQTATSLYEKVKDYNTVTNWTLSTAENTVCKAIDISKPITTPVVAHLEGPIKKVDSMLCSGLDYVEAKVPAVKLPPDEMYTNTKDYVSKAVTPAMDTACSVVQSAMQTTQNVVCPVYQGAISAVEPLVHPAVDKACSIKDYGTQKMEELLQFNKHSGTTEEDSANQNAECDNTVLTVPTISQKAKNE